jgi:hypothetical protein
MADTGELRIDDLLALVETGRELAGEVNLNSLLRSILDKAIHLTDSSDASLILPSEDRKKLYIAQAIGPNAETVLRERGQSSEGIPLESIAGKVFQTRTARVTNAVDTIFGRLIAKLGRSPRRWSACP